MHACGGNDVWVYPGITRHAMMQTWAKWEIKEGPGLGHDSSGHTGMGGGGQLVPYQEPGSRPTLPSQTVDRSLENIWTKWKWPLSTETSCASGFSPPLLIFSHINEHGKKMTESWQESYFFLSCSHVSNSPGFYSWKNMYIYSLIFLSLGIRWNVAFSWY